MCLKEKGEGLFRIIKQVVMIFLILHRQLGFKSFLAVCLEQNLLHYEYSAESSAGRVFGLRGFSESFMLHPQQVPVVYCFLDKLPIPDEDTLCKIPQL